MPSASPRADSFLARFALACSAALLAPLAWPLVTGRIFSDTDLGFFHVPLRAAYQAALGNGDSILWSPALFAGYYVHGEGQSGLLHPLHLLLYGALPLQAAFNLEFLASYVAAFIGMFAFCRRLGIGRPAALLGAMLYAFSGFQLLHFLHVNLVAGGAHIPWTLAFTDTLLRADDRRYRAIGFAGLASTIASAALVGFPQALWWNLLAAGPFMLFRGVQSRSSRRLLGAAAAVSAGLLTGAVQLLPTADVTLESARTLSTRTFALSYSLHPWNLLQLWSPYVFRNRVFGAGEYPWIHELGVYSGAILVCALPWLWMRRHRLSDPPAAAFLAAFAAVALVLALGRYGGLAVLLTHLPGIGSLRAPVRYIVLVQLALCALTAMTIDAMLLPRTEDSPRDRLLPAALPLVLTAATAVFVASGAMKAWRLPAGTVQGAAAGFAIVGIVTVTLLLLARGRRRALPVLLLVTAGDLGWYGLSYVYKTPPQSIGELTAGLAPAPERTADRYTGPAVWGNRLMLAGYRMPDGYVALYPLTALPYTDPPFQRLAGARWAFDANGSLRELPGAFERARLIRDVHVSANPRAVINDVDLRQTAVASDPVGGLGRTTGTIVVVSDRPGRLVVRASGDGRQLLALSERFHRGWRATVDGRPERVLRINGDFMGCVIEPGTHEIVLRFRPSSFTAGCVVSLIGLACIVAGARLW